MDKIEKELLNAVADLHDIPTGSYNIRKNGKLLSRSSDEDITIVSKTGVDGIDIYVKPGIKGKSVHIPVILTESGIHDSVVNDFHIGEGAEVVIIAGCGIHTSTGETSHLGNHNFYLEKNSKVKYIERHIGMGGKAKKIFTPNTNIKMNENSFFEMETSQLGGVSFSERNTTAILNENAKLQVTEKILTEDEDECISTFEVFLNETKSSCEIVSRGVARGYSQQKFSTSLIGNSECFGHIECDAIVTDKSRIVSIPQIEANDVNASLVHEAAIGKIANEQIIKLMTLGLDEHQAETFIINGFLK